MHNKVYEFRKIKTMNNLEPRKYLCIKFIQQLLRPFSSISSDETFVITTRNRDLEQACLVRLRQVVVLRAAAAHE
jgi:hypothetical protein